MKREELTATIQQSLVEGESLIGFFYAQQQFKIGLWFLIGSLAAFTLKHYYTVVTTHGIHFYQMDLWGKLGQHDFFRYSEIQRIKMRQGFLRTSLEYFFETGRTLKLRSPHKGLKHILKLEESVINYLKAHVLVA
jgi:hypothetical protein